MVKQRKLQTLVFILEFGVCGEIEGKGVLGTGSGIAGYFISIGRMYVKVIGDGMLVKIVLEYPKCIHFGI